MASLGFNYQKPPFISLNQTRPSFFLHQIKMSDPSLTLKPFVFLPPSSSDPSPPPSPASLGDEGRPQRRPRLVEPPWSPLPLSNSLCLSNPQTRRLPPPFHLCFFPFPDDSGGQMKTQARVYTMTQREAEDKPSVVTGILL